MAKITIEAGYYQFGTQIRFPERSEYPNQNATPMLADPDFSPNFIQFPYTPHGAQTGGSDITVDFQSKKTIQIGYNTAYQGGAWSSLRYTIIYLNKSITFEEELEKTNTAGTNTNFYFFMNYQDNPNFVKLSELPDDPCGDLKINKVVEWNDQQVASATEFEVDLKVNNIDYPDNPIKITTSNSAIIYDIPANYKYEVTEREDPDGRYYEKSDNYTREGTITKGSVQNEVTFTNVEEPSYLTVSKQVVSDDEADKSIDFDFTATVGSQSPASFSLKHGQSKQFTARVGDRYSITEAANDNFTVDGGAMKTGTFDTVGGTSTVTFTNRRKETPPEPPDPPEPPEPTGGTVYGVYPILGTGDRATRINEITSDVLATARNFYMGYTEYRNAGGVAKIDGHDFSVIPHINTVAAETTFTFDDKVKPFPWRITSNSVDAVFESDGTPFTGMRMTIQGEIDYKQGATYINAYNVLIGWVNSAYKIVKLISPASIDDKTYKWLSENSTLKGGHYGTTFSITDGYAFAYGYWGHCPATSFTFQLPAVEQYHVVYAEINRSIIPNAITVKTLNNQASSRILLNTFRQDQLSTVKTGVYQVPLWLIKITNKGMVDDDTYPMSLRNIRPCIEHVVYADIMENLGGTISPNAEILGDMKPYDTSDKTVATTEWVRAIVDEEIRR